MTAVEIHMNRLIHTVKANHPLAKHFSSLLPKGSWSHLPLWDRPEERRIQKTCPSKIHKAEKFFLLKKGQMPKFKKVD